MNTARPRRRPRYTRSISSVVGTVIDNSAWWFRGTGRLSWLIWNGIWTGRSPRWWEV
jgi:hypothetical protein